MDTVLLEMISEARRKISELRQMRLEPGKGGDPRKLADQLEQWTKDAERLLKIAA